MQVKKKALALLLSLIMIVSLFGGMTLTGATEESSGNKAYFIRANNIVPGNEIIIVAKDGDNYYALTGDGETSGVISIDVDGEFAIVTSDDPEEAVWRVLEDATLISVTGEKGSTPYFYAFSGGMVFTSGRIVSVENGEFTYGVSGGAKGYLGFKDGAFTYTKNAEEAGDIQIFTRINPGVKASALENGEQYYIVAKGDDGYYALGSDGKTGFSRKATVSASESCVYSVSGDVTLWTFVSEKSMLKSVAGEDGEYPYFYPYSGGMVFSSGREVSLINGEFSYGVSGGAKGYLSFKDGTFGYTKVAEEAGNISIYRFISPLDKFTITFDANMAGVDGLKGTKTEGKPYVISEELDVKGYNFIGWNTAADGSGDAYAVGDSITADQDLILYAIWEESEAIVYEFVETSSITIGAPVVYAVTAGDHTYALSTDGETVTATEVMLRKDANTDRNSIVVTGEKAIWLVDQYGFMTNEFFENAKIAFTAGLTVADKGGVTHFDRNSGKLTFHLADLEKVDYYLSFDGITFGLTADPEAACDVTPYSQSLVFARAAEMKAGEDYVVALKAGSYWIALNYDGSLGTAYISYNEKDDTVTISDEGAAWSYAKDQVLESVYEPNNAIFAGSGGFLLYDSTGSYRRTFTYNPETKTVNLHGTRFVLIYDEEDREFDQSTDASAAIQVDIFSRPSLLHGEGYIPDGSDLKPVVRDAQKNDDGSITLAFTSDVHYDGKYMNLETWLNAADVGYIDAMGFCGDMGSAYASSADDFWTWTATVMDYMDTREDVGTEVYTFGNHEWFPSAGGNFKKEYERDAAKRLLRIGEGIRTDDYIIYCFGAGNSAIKYKYDYSDDDIVRLKEYMSTAPTDRPIFILTHYPLHYWYGRNEEREIAHAGDVIDVLNSAVEAGHEIILLWGHNHSDYDDHYYQPVFPGEDILIAASTDEDTGVMTPDENGTRTLNFTYVAAGCTADAEYSSEQAGSAACLNKGLIVTINADGSLTYTYYTIDGQPMYVESPWLVRFREGLKHTDNIALQVIDTQYVKDGETAEVVEAPIIEGYEFTGWVTREGGKEVKFDFEQPITRNMLVSANYERVIEDVGDQNYIYITIELPDGTAVGKDGTVIALYPLPYEEGMTLIDAITKVHELEYPEGLEGIHFYEPEYQNEKLGFWSADLLWGLEPANGSLVFNPTVDGCYVDAADTVEAGASYYILAYGDQDTTYRSTSFMNPGKVTAALGVETKFSALSFVMDSNYKYTITPIAPEKDNAVTVWLGKDYENLTETDTIVNKNGVFYVTFDEEGEYVLAVRSENSFGEAVAFVEALPLQVYTITFESSVDTIDALTASKLEGVPYEITETLTRSGYNFLGWNTAADGSGKPYAVGDYINDDADLTLYAQWEKKSSGGGSSGGSSSSGTKGKITVTDIDNENGKITVSHKSASKGTKVTVTVTPDKGYQIGSIKVTDKNNKEVKLTDAGDGVYTFEMPNGAVTIDVTFERLNPFVDVVKGDYYYDAVLWAYFAEPQITNGMDETHFEPNTTTSRAHVVTFLWRACGCQEPAIAENPFEDISESDYFYKAVLWAYEKGIIKGTDETHFTPKQTCSTAHIVTMIYRALGAGTDGWYEEAGEWAENLGLQKDMDLTVDRDVDCPRGAIVTFLYRALAK